MDHRLGTLCSQCAALERTLPLHNVLLDLIDHLDRRLGQSRAGTKNAGDAGFVQEVVILRRNHACNAEEYSSSRTAYETDEMFTRTREFFGLTPRDYENKAFIIKNTYEIS